MIPNSTAASPDGTYCSPQYTSPYATANRSPAPSSGGQSSRPILMATQVLLQMITSSPYNAKTSERLTPIEAIDGRPAPPCHTIARVSAAAARERTGYTAPAAHSAERLVPLSTGP